MEVLCIVVELCFLQTPEVDDQEDDELRARLAKLTN